MPLGLIDLPWWGYIVVALAFTHITIASVTIYLHRHQAHRALDLHPIPSHFFRFWLWLTTGMITKEWAAIHRKHHAKCETPEDPHSPQVLGIKKVFFEGAELYKAARKQTETMEKYGHGAPDDWLERNIYAKHSGTGIVLMLLADVLLFGPLGLTIWAVQMMWIPITAAGIINGIGHYWGYRNFACEDASTNVFPWGILIGGEELHNNHHAYGTSAKLSNKWYEFDIGWMYIRIMEMLGIAKVKKMAPKVRFNSGKAICDFDTLQAIITHRYDVMTKYTRSVKSIYAEEISRIKTNMPDLNDLATMKTIKHWLHLDASELQDQEKAKLSEILSKSQALATVYAMRQELVALWARSTASKEQLVQQLQDWCQRAESSNIDSLQQFSRKLRCYA
ncbi:DesA family fatty acid desaturase [Sulfurirhabdus autotrophica]|uniref:Stearoyl-CoA desaturase (Delta-9 desaturase) n=1 Tax=Sulfurirhabdus autotrophica TaxID=1706046 RepID=A0A4R3XTC7_9PROT|nr:fatty acid desaturase [Sulfurirhabdus autotrophica]TCV81243.1 stearoyl-CoA desaturase (delta-9 desaturase) [Sulfurirhabdus autotrophica]